MSKRGMQCVTALVCVSSISDGWRDKRNDSRGSN